jgi:predicted alpha/beta superfamily hydrolase
MIACVLAATLALAPAAQERVSSLTGDIRKHPGFRSEVLGNRRNLAVYLPPGYDEQTGRRYPVLYMHDGQNVFDGMTSFIPNKEWEADEAADRLIRAGKIEPIIIVAIDNAGMERGNEFLPTRAMGGGSREPYGGKADLYGRMISDEIKPMIDSTYRTKRGRADTALCGSSFGGIVTLHLGLTRPDVFGKIAVVSPSLWWDEGVMMRRAEQLPRKLDLRIWLDMGTREGYVSLQNTRRLKWALEDRGWKIGKDLAYMEDSMAMHNEAAWAKRMEPILLFLFGTGPSPK